MVGESCCLAHSKGNVWSGVGAQVEQHANDGAVIPLLSHWHALGVRPKTNNCTWLLGCDPATFGHGKLPISVTDTNELELGLILAAPVVKASQKNNTFCCDFMGAKLHMRVWKVSMAHLHILEDE